MSNYKHRLGPRSQDGQIKNIRVRWPDRLFRDLDRLSLDRGVPMATMKAFCEHAAYKCAKRLGARKVAVLAVPHDYTIDSRTQARHGDALHITVEIQGRDIGQKKAHLYIEGVGEDSTAYDDLRVVAESVSGGGRIYQRLSRDLDAIPAVTGTLAPSTMAATATASSSTSASSGATQQAQAATSAAMRPDPMRIWDPRLNIWVRYDHNTTSWYDDYGNVVNYG